jgi:hypothetical protein
MTVSGFVPGVAIEAPLLAQFAKPALVPPENFVGNIVFPDQQVPSFLGIAPITGNEQLEAFDDDTIGDGTDFPEVTFEQGEYQWELGYHGRKATITVVQKIKAAMAKAMAVGMGDNASNPQFDLESRVTNLITAQHIRHNEFLKIGQLLRTANYADGNVRPSIAIDTMPTASFLAVLADAARRVEAAGKGPANTIIFGDGAWSGALTNANFSSLLPDTAYKIMTPDAFTPILRLPSQSTTDAPLARILIASATYKAKRKSAPIPMMNLHIWIGRTNPSPTGNGDGFGFNFWHPAENGQQIMVSRLVFGIARTVQIGVEGFYRPVTNDGALGVLIPVTVAA